MKIATACIEVCRADELVGYAIHFSGGWDSYRRDGVGNLRMIGSNFPTQAEAIRAVEDDQDYRDTSGRDPEATEPN